MTDEQDRPPALAAEVARRQAAGTFEQYIHTEIGEVRPGHATLAIEIQPFHLNGNGTLHGGVYATPQHGGTCLRRLEIYASKDLHKAR